MELSNIGQGKFLIVIVGPTAVGKSEVAIEIARKFETDIISADSRQFYKELNIGTAKPTSIQLNAAKHHFIDSHSIQDYYSAGGFERDVLKLLDSLFARSSTAILVGGSGMYIDAVCNGMNDQPEVPQEIRLHYKNLLKERGLDALVEELRIRDLPYYNLVDKNNPQRVVRALEVCLFTGQKFSSFNKNQLVKRPFNIVKIGLTLDRELLYKRIDVRMEKMIKDGLFDEAKQLHPFKDLYALQTVGYTEIFNFMEGQYDKDEAVRLLKRNSRRYSKRQMTWFKRDQEIQWFNPESKEDIDRYVTSRIKENQPS